MTKQIKNLLTRYWAVIILILLLLFGYSTEAEGYSVQENASSSDVVEDISTIDELNYYNKAVEEALTKPIKAACQEVEEYYKEEEKNRPKLNNTNGVFYGPNGKETYYNLNMKEVVARMHRLGYSGDYWIRQDGVKMFGDYVMVAANLKKFPRGSIVDTSLGKGIVCDTGGFVYNGSGVVFDLAVAWK